MDKSDSKDDKQILKIFLFSLSLVFMLDCYFTARHYFNIYNVLFMLIIYPIMFFIVLKFNDAFLDLINDTERTVKIEKRFFFLLSIIMAFMSSTDHFLKYSMISLSSALINYSIHYFLRFCIIYVIILLFSKSYKKKL